MAYCLSWQQRAYFQLQIEVVPDVVREILSWPLWKRSNLRRSILELTFQYKRRLVVAFLNWIQNACMSIVNSINRDRRDHKQRSWRTHDAFSYPRTTPGRTHHRLTSLRSLQRSYVSSPLGHEQQCQVLMKIFLPHRPTWRLFQPADKEYRLG